MQQFARRKVAIRVPGQGAHEMELSVRDPDGNPSESTILDALFKNEAVDFDVLFGLLESGKLAFLHGIPGNEKVLELIVCVTGRDQNEIDIRDGKFRLT